MWQTKTERDGESKKTKNQQVIDKTVTIMVTMMTMIIQDLLESMTETDQDHHKAMSILAEKEEGESDTRATGAGKITRESQE